MQKRLTAQPKWTERLGHVALLAVAALGVLKVTALLVVVGYRQVAWTQDISAAKARIGQLEVEVRELERRADKAQNDASYLEALARRQGFVKKGEQVLVPVVP